MTAQSRSAVLSTITPALPPSSRTTFFLPARSFIRQPTDGDPVNVRSLNRSSATIRSPELAGHGQDAHGTRRHAGRFHDLRHGQHGERVFRGRLEHDRVTAGDGRRELVGGEVEREVERRDASDRADREAAGDADAVLRGGHQVERDELARHPFRLFGAETEGERRAIDLDQRIADGLAGLEGDELAELLAAGLDAARDLAEDPPALVGRQLPCDLEGVDGSVDRLLVLLRRRVVRRPGRVGRIGRIRHLQSIG